MAAVEFGYGVAAQKVKRQIHGGAVAANIVL
jgi:hypothetical protein